MRSDDAQELDAVLERGLASYSTAEPQVGMEERILRTVLAQRESRRMWWPWAAGAFATASALIVMVVALTHPKTVPVPSVATATPAARTVVAPSPAETEVRNAAAAPRKHSSGVGASHARTSEPQKPAEEFLFPTAQTLTQEEIRVVNAVEERPGEVSKALEEAQRRSSEPVHVAAIHIEPLNNGGQQQEE
jgi:hypothetical protein